ncbi:hypothetical protein [Microbacterium sp. SZ1]|uniref:hypothetical protein n=1 Tax=Microbacterium sp. SZ1 TaxID=1849736 RepID=UPI001180C2F5|nr:hypothetical protein [Microbacterium sp. SZ1]
MLLRSRSSCLTLGAVAVLIGMLSACAPPPAPTPSPTPAFASEEDAFAAAEKVYRAYNDAENAERGGDHTADPNSYLTGPALETALSSRRLVEQAGWTLVGDGEVDTFSGTKAHLTASPAKVAARVCLDVAGTRVLDKSGADVTPADRLTRVLLDIEFITESDRLLIAKTEAAEDETC